MTPMNSIDVCMKSPNVEHDIEVWVEAMPNNFFAIGMRDGTWCNCPC